MSRDLRLGIAGGALMGVTFGMARYAYGLMLPAIRSALDVPELVLGLIGSGTFAGFLLSLLTAPSLARWQGPRAPTTLGGASAAVGCAVVALAPTSGVLALGALVSGSAAGWVWASYSTIVVAVVAPGRRARLLAGITTGATGGLVVVGALALVVDSWRWTWGSIALAAAVATEMNRRWVPRLPPLGPVGARRAMVPGPGLARPIGFAVVLFVGATAYFTYATDAAERGGLGPSAGPAIFVLVGAAGATGLAAGALADRVGARTVAIAALLGLGAALVLLGLGGSSLPAVLASAVVFGGANTVGSAALPVWTADSRSRRSGPGLHQHPGHRLGGCHAHPRGDRGPPPDVGSARRPARRGGPHGPRGGRPAPRSTTSVTRPHRRGTTRPPVRSPTAAPPAGRTPP